MTDQIEHIDWANKILSYALVYYSASVVVC
jgi:hypothetical protein